MGLFSKFSKKEPVAVFSPVKGSAVSLEKVNDPTFSSGVLGKGIAVIPGSSRFVAPCDGKISTLFHTKHAYAISSDSGAEVLVHIGLETVQLDGKYFESHANEGDMVKKGDLIVTADIEKIKEAGYDIITSVLICNSDDYSNVESSEEKPVNEAEEIIILKR